MEATEGGGQNILSLNSDSSGGYDDDDWEVFLRVFARCCMPYMYTTCAIWTQDFFEEDEGSSSEHSDKNGEGVNWGPHGHEEAFSKVQRGSLSEKRRLRSFFSAAHTRACTSCDTVECPADKDSLFMHVWWWCGGGGCVCVCLRVCKCSGARAREWA